MALNNKSIFSIMGNFGRNRTSDYTKPQIIDIINTIDAELNSNHVGIRVAAATAGDPLTFSNAELDDLINLVMRAR